MDSALKQDKPSERFVAERYEILSTLDQGGESPVYRAKDTVTGRIVAVKFLQANRQYDALALGRFMQAAEKVSKLNHPRLATLLDFGLADETRPFTVVEYVEGRNLVDVLNRTGRLRFKQGVDIFIQLAELFDFLHANEITHGNLRPSYLTIVWDRDENPTVKLTDHGLEKALAFDTTGRSDRLRGNNFYLTPEECKGTALDSRSDVYSLGCLMYEALTGIPPFASKLSHEVVQMHINDEPKSMREVRSDLRLTVEIDLLVQRALRKNAGQRQQSMRDLKDDLMHVKRKLVDSHPMDQTSSHSNLMAFPSTTWSATPPAPTRMSSGLRIKMLVPVMLGVFVVAGSAIVGSVLQNKFTSGKVMKTSTDDFLWQECDRKGQNFLLQGQLPNAETEYLNALAIAERFGEHDRRMLLTLRRLQDVYMTEGKQDKSDEIEERIKALLAD